MQQYREEYKEQGRDPGLLEAIGYDSGRMLRQLVEKKEGAPRTRAEMREALANLKDFEGATGRTSFNEKREAVKPLFLLSIDNKGITEINVEKEKEKAASASGGSGS